jgi:hypothetical protein
VILEFVPVRSTAQREFTVSDALALVAAAALGAALLRPTLAYWFNPENYPDSNNSRARQISWSVCRALACMLPFLTCLTPVLLLLRLRRPRPPLRRLFGQAGAVACAAATFAIATDAVWVLSLLAAGSTYLSPETLFPNFEPHVGFAVLGGWSVLALRGWGRSDRSWIERAGKATGVAWLLTTAVIWVANILWL